MKQRAAPLPHPATVTPASAARAAGAGSSGDEARARAASDETAQAILERLRSRLADVDVCTQAEDLEPDTASAWAHAAAHAPYGGARLPSTARWGGVAEAYRAVAASVARGDLVQAVSRLRQAERLDDEARRSAPWVLPALRDDPAPWRGQVPRVFATPRTVPPDIDALADRVAHREGATRRPGVLDDLHTRPPPAPEPDDDLE